MNDRPEHLVRVDAASVSDQGGRRRNEDAFAVWRGPHLFGCVVADGAGGHGGGDIAAGIVVAATLRELQALDAVHDGVLESMLHHANSAVLDAQRSGGVQRDMRSTVALVVIDLSAASARCAHCGDTRVYGFRDGAIFLQTRDHSMVQSLVDANLLAAAQMRGHPQRNVLFSALGTRDDLTIAVSVAPFALESGDALLICTDGLWDYVDEGCMIATLSAAHDPAEWLASMEKHLRASAPARHDNFTAVALWVGH